MSATTVFSGRLFFSPKTMPANLPGQAPLTVGQFLVVDKDKSSIEVLNVLQCPIDLPSGNYEVSCEPRAKKGKPGISYWFLGAQKSSQAS